MLRKAQALETSRRELRWTVCMLLLLVASAEDCSCSKGMRLDADASLAPDASFTPDGGQAMPSSLTVCSPCYHKPNGAIDAGCGDYGCRSGEVCVAFDLQCWCTTNVAGPQGCCCSGGSGGLGVSDDRCHRPCGVTATQLGQPSNCAQGEVCVGMWVNSWVGQPEPCTDVGVQAQVCVSADAGFFDPPVPSSMAVCDSFDGGLPACPNGHPPWLCPDVYEICWSNAFCSDGGCTRTAPFGDGLCHRSCMAGLECAAGEVCRSVSLNVSCSADGGTTSICCPADGGCP